MPVLDGFHGPFSLAGYLPPATNDARFVVYLAGESSGGRFLPALVARCEARELAVRLARLEASHREGMTAFFYRELDAFRKECVVYHLHHLSLHELPHPPRLDGSDWMCPGCPAFN